jgi:hypothetical protein
MKNIIYYLSILMLILGSCTEYLDYHEQDFYTEEEIFNSVSRSGYMLNNLYGKLPNGINAVGDAMRDAASDDAEEADATSSIQIMNDGRWSPLRTIDANWDEMYKAIRSANLFLQKWDISILENYRYNADYLNLVKDCSIWKEQARFLRAFYYFELIKRYGDVPLLADEILTLEDANKVQPGSYETVKNFIINECDAVAAVLPKDYTKYAGDQLGRVTKGTAMALKARTLLYAASPLHNPDNSQSKWIDAAKAAWAIIDSARSRGWYSLEANYSNLVNNSATKELIFGRRFAADNAFERANFPVGFIGANPGACPTQNLVDTYEMTNGMDINEPGSGYNPADPYANRDPRLGKTIILNNSTYKSRKVETFIGGLDGSPISYATRTGYYLKKYLVESVNLDPVRTTTARHVVIYFRYGEILLDYAEAMNEAYGPDFKSAELGLSAYEAVQLIRTRAGMPNFTAGMSKDEFRRELQEERRVELAFEDHRFWDVRRWKIGNQTTDIRGMNITKNPDGSFTYNPVTIETRVWDDKMYLYPMLQSEIFKNSNLKQTPGW